MKLILLEGSVYSYSPQEASLSLFFESTFEGLGALNKDDSITFYQVSVVGIALGTIWQNDDSSWTARPVNDKFHEHLVKGFSHELYAAEYLEKRAAQEGLLAGTERIFEMTVS